MLEATDRVLLLRTSWVYSSHGHNFVNTMLRLAGDRDTLSVVADQRGAPTWARDLATITVQAIEAVPDADAQRARSGVYHATNAGETTWYDFARAIFRHAGLDHVRVEPISTGDYPTPAARPGYSVLSNRRLHETFGLRLQPWEDALRQCLDERLGG